MPSSQDVSVHPEVAVLAVLVRGDEVMLVRRANPPDAGKWGFPGGRIEPGETMAAAALRELFEETAISATAHGVITALDAFAHDPKGVLTHHHVLVAMLCHWQAGDPVAGDDALEAQWVPRAVLSANALDVSLNVPELAELAFARDAEGALP